MYCGKPCVFGTIFKGPDKYSGYRADLALWAGFSDCELLIIHSLRSANGADLAIRPKSQTVNY